MNRKELHMMPKYKNDLRKKMLEEFLNDEVTTIRYGLYTWHEKHYQVIARKQITRYGMSVDSFILRDFAGRKYGIREMSDSLMKKWYASTQPDGNDTFPIDK